MVLARFHNFADSPQSKARQNEREGAANLDRLVIVVALVIAEVVAGGSNS